MTMMARLFNSVREVKQRRRWTGSEQGTVHVHFVLLNEKPCGGTPTTERRGFLEVGDGQKC